MRILNLYAGIGGNRKLWGPEHAITAVEHDPQIAAVYATLYPDDELVIGDAHAFLLANYQRFDFIWSSPPCQTHSSMRANLRVRFGGVVVKFPDMSLYEEIILLQTYANDTLWVVENVVPYYNNGKPLIPAQRVDRHLYWANFHIPRSAITQHENLRAVQVPELERMHGFDLSGFKLRDRRQVLRNCVPPATGLRILHAAESAAAGDAVGAPVVGVHQPLF